MVGQLDLRKRISFAQFLLAFRDKDITTLGATLRSLSKPFRPPDESGYQRQFEQRIGPLIDSPPGQSTPLQKLVTEALDVLHSTGYRLDPELTLAAKAVAQAEAITSALVPEADASQFAELGGAALEELVPEAVGKDAILRAARRQAMLAAGEVAQRLPTVQDAARVWLDQLQRGEIPVRINLADVDRAASRLEAVPRLIGAAVVITGVVIGSALAAGISTGGSGFRSSLADASLVIYLGATAVAVLLAVALLWRLVRPQGRHSRRVGGAD
jgi:predicted unusual protein kinase regulating ubiquinone biosynthesis (AarF/ABC1/UbiB family)